MHKPICVKGREFSIRLGHIQAITDLLEHAVATARNLPPEMQDDIARMVLMYAGEDHSIIQLSAEEDAALDESEIAAARGEFATDEQMKAIWTKHAR